MKVMPDLKDEKDEKIVINVSSLLSSLAVGLMKFFLYFCAIMFPLYIISKDAIGWSSFETAVVIPILTILFIIPTMFFYVKALADRLSDKGDELRKNMVAWLVFFAPLVAVVILKVLDTFNLI